MNEISVDNTLVSGMKADRNFEHRFFAVFAALFVIAVLVGFGPTFYLKPLFDTRPIARTVIWVHGFVMAAWVVLFVAQVYFISSKKIKTHQKLGLIGIVIGAMLVVSGLFVAIGAAKYGVAPQGIPPLEFMLIPFSDLIVFSILFGAAIYFRKKAAEHKRLILLSMIVLLPPAIARFPGGFPAALGPLWFLGVPTLLIIAFILGDRWRTGKLNNVFLIAGVLVIVGMWIRLPLSSTTLWLNVATWLTS